MSEELQLAGDSDQNDLATSLRQFRVERQAAFVMAGTFHQGERLLSLTPHPHTGSPVDGSI